MAKLSGILKLKKSEDKEVVKTLNMLERHQTPVRVEIEGAQIRFNTIISIKRGMVIIAKPSGLIQELKTGGLVRMKIPEADARELRLEIITPNFNLTSGSAVFLCKIPHEFAEGARRSSERYNTTRFNNLLIKVEELESGFRILDLSIAGCRVQHQSTAIAKLFPLGTDLAPAEIMLGSKVRVLLATLIPKMHAGTAVGLEFQVSPQGSNKKFLQHLLISLEKAEDERLQTAAM